MGNSGSQPRKVTLENNTPIFISDELRDRLSSAATDHAPRLHDSELSPDDVRPTKPDQLGAKSFTPTPSSVTSTLIPPEERMTLGEETAMALLRMREERDRELARMQSEYFAKIRKAEEDFANINKLKEDEYVKAVEETRGMFQKPRMAACGDVEKTVLECYKANPSETLNCYSLVAQFHDCVASTRVREALEKKCVPARSG
jgi:coiled-coil-helix-coiled-coil-helix domain-containing protein 3